MASSGDHDRMALAEKTPERLSAWRWLPVWRRNLRVWRKLLGPSLLGNFGEPLLYLLALGYGLGSLVGEIQQMPYIVFLASGIVCSSAMYTASFEGMYSAYTRMAVQKTWDAMLTAPLEVTDVVRGEVVWAATKSLISGSAILLVAGALDVVDSWRALWALPTVFLTGLCFGAMALVVTSFAKNYDFFLYYNTLLMTPMLLLGGVFFPLERLPSPVQALAEFLPLTHAVAVVRPVMTGSVVANPIWHLAILFAYGLGALALASTLIRRRLMA